MKWSISSSQRQLTVLRAQTYSTPLKPGDQIPAPPPANCVCLGNSLELSVSAPLSVLLRHVPPSHSGYEDQVHSQGTRLALHEDFSRACDAKRFFQTCGHRHALAPLQVDMWWAWDPPVRCVMSPLRINKKKLSGAMLDTKEFTDHFVYKNPLVFIMILTSSWVIQHVKISQPPSRTQIIL